MDLRGSKQRRPCGLRSRKIYFVNSVIVTGGVPASLLMSDARRLGVALICSTQSAGRRNYGHYSPGWWRNSFTLRACLGSLPTLFFPLARPLPYFQKIWQSTLRGPIYRREKFPIARALQERLVSSRHTKNRLGRVLKSSLLDGHSPKSFR